VQFFLTVEGRPFIGRASFPRQPGVLADAYDLPLNDFMEKASDGPHNFRDTANGGLPFNEQETILRC
jgi:hypothetical protein